MTNVKFRAWDIRSKRYVRIDAIKFDHLGEGRPFILVSEGQEWAIGGFVLEQWTGLKDKNGREIYEGDIVPVGESGRVVAVSIKALPSPNYWGAILGNIHENPELLK